MKLDKDFNEFVTLFVASDVRFLIVGGYALAAHGLPRATGDLDVWVWISPVNAAKIRSALEEFGFSGLGITTDDFSRGDSIVQLGYPPYRIDILTSISGVEFDAAWDNRLVVDLDGVEVPFISRRDLIVNKRAAGRPQDVADVERLTNEDSS
ncbi:MAG: DUF6036 family nucleotidyltransferase [Ilumatobacteraceae bacterium]